MITNTPAVTIYNKYLHSTTKAELWQRTVVLDVTWENTKGRSILATGGTIAANQAVLFIPFERGSNYKSPKTWLALPVKTGMWTLQVNDMIVRGNVPEEITDLFTVSSLKEKYDDVLAIASVDAMDIGSFSMQHWEVGLK